MLGLLQRLVRLFGQWDFIYTFSHHPVDQGTARLMRLFGGFWMTDWCDLWNSQQGGILDRRLWTDPNPPMTRGLSGARLKVEYLLEDFCEISAPADADATSIIVSPMRELTRKVGVADKKVLHLVSGSDTENVKPLDQIECRHALGLPKSRIIVGYVANYTPDNVLLSGAMEIVWRKRKDLILISAGPKWYEASDPMGRAAREGRLRDFGRRPYSEIPTLLGASDLLVMPLRDVPFNRYRWPNKFGDYLASGRPTATTAIGDVHSVIRKWETGLAGPPTSEGLARAILELAEEREARERMGERAREVAVSHLGWEGRIDRLCRFLRRRGLEL